ncbi:TPA: hypothetical protein QDA94_000463 [Burkholderia vietnamiensis]|nr:hypothetical protein [Burkholderia vietnamiensis]HDR9230496.1 hypothetical protein [Burkholderia vietnamiensis]
MKTIEVIAAFNYSENGYTVDAYLVGDICEASDACAAEAVENGWATELTEEDLAKACAAYDKLCKAAEKAEAAAVDAQAKADELHAAAKVAREKASAARVGRAAEQQAAELE